MAILAALIALGSRFATKILTTALGWATTLLFGRVPASRQIALLAITFGSVIWAVLVVGVIVPDVGTFLLLLVPSQDVRAGGGDPGGDAGRGPRRSRDRRVPDPVAVDRRPIDRGRPRSRPSCAATR